jgi:hypothetical protein
MRVSQRTIFSLLLLGVTLLALGGALQLGSVARLVPLRVVIPTLILLLLQVVLDVAADLGKSLPVLDKLGLSSRRQEAGNPEARAMAQQPAAAWPQELRVMAWLGLLLVLVMGLGFGLGSPLYVGLFFKLRGGQSWLLSLAVAGLTALIMQLLFVGLLDMPLSLPF